MEDSFTNDINFSIICAISVWPFPLSSALPQLLEMRLSAAIPLLLMISVPIAANLRWQNNFFQFHF